VKVKSIAFPEQETKNDLESIKKRSRMYRIWYVLSDPYGWISLIKSGQFTLSFLVLQPQLAIKTRQAGAVMKMSGACLMAPPPTRPSQNMGLGRQIVPE
jgi:hypothetical protein